MTNQTNAFEDLFSKTTDYLETKGELLQLKVVDKTADMASSLVSGLVIGVVCCLAVIMLSIGMAIWVGRMLGEEYLGFFIIAGLYLIASLVLYIGRKNLLKSPVGNLVVKKLLN
ncbi:phage holin family protein [Ferruginibacter lapsinanis]|uniref:phage holin family protein n=1 Tax=Ferruginibacter lapsinanis TaxID=563172 RepID=UPI001E4BC00E|nr:phage holin family protein [Ferruginibacter lapsinanis]UEG51047.1 phage holin family protein [Ferruginibacter lapsinanis]